MEAEGEERLLVGLEPRPVRVHVVPEVDVSATKPSVGRSDFVPLPYFPLLFSLLRCPLYALSPPPSRRHPQNE